MPSPRLGKVKGFCPRLERSGRQVLVAIEMRIIKFGTSVGGFGLVQVAFRAKFAPKPLERKAESAIRGDRRYSSLSRPTHGLFQADFAKHDSGG